MSEHRHLEILRESFNADIREAQRDGISVLELIALTGALVEDLMMALPDDMRQFGLNCVLETLPERIKEREREESRS